MGLGFDSHRLIKNRKLVLGGVEIPNDHVGLDGHSDADIVIHALIDAILGAAALGDIGTLFPNNDLKYKNIDSSRLLREVLDLIKGYELVNIDVIIVAEFPKLSPYIFKIRENLSALLGCEISKVSVKAKTAEKMGSIGRGEGMQAQAICLLKII